MKKVFTFFVKVLIFYSLQISSSFAQQATAPTVGDGSITDPYEIATLENLYWIAESSSRWGATFYKQVADIDASETINWFEGQGWSPIGNGTTPFYGFYYGEGHSIDGLYINRPGTNYVGLFGNTSSSWLVENDRINNLILSNVQITGGDYVSGLAGYSYQFIIVNCSITGVVNGTGKFIGGLVGRYRSNIIDNCYSEADVSGDEYVGGLVGEVSSGSTILNCTSTGNVSGRNSVGGLVGSAGYCNISNSMSSGYVIGTALNTGGLVGNNNNASVTNSHSTGYVSGVDNVGGLAGINNNSAGKILDCYSTGNVNGRDYVGGLVGKNTFPDIGVAMSYSTGDVNGRDYVGGIIGYLHSSSALGNYSSGSVTGNQYVGGLVGYTSYSAYIYDCYSTGSVSGNSITGGLVGINNWDCTVSRCYSIGWVNGSGSTIGGLTGNNWATVTNGYWNTETSNQSASTGGEGRTTEQMTYPYPFDTYLNFDFSGIWEEDSFYVNNGYPYFSWQDFPDPILVLLSPEGGESWQAGTKKTVYWNSNTTSPINILLSFNNGTSWVYLNTAPLSAPEGYFSFTVPFINSEECLIKIESVHIPNTFFDISESTFAITTSVPPSVTLTSPEGSIVKIQSARGIDISWMANEVNNINLEITYNSGLSWQEIAQNVPASQGSYNWLVPDSLSVACYFRVSDYENPANNDWSDHPFTITKLEMINPAGGEQFIGGSAINIEWESDNIDFVKLEYSTDNGENWLIINDSINAELSSYTWSLPVIPSQQCLLRIKDKDHEMISDETAIPFEVLSKYLTITSPNDEGMRLRSAEHSTITWIDADISSLLNLYFSSDGGVTFNEIAGNIDPEDGIFDWVVPDVNTTKGMIKISLADDPDIYFITENNFTIFELELTSPVGGEFWSSATYRSITWSQYNMSNVKLEYSDDGGDTWKTIIASTSAGTGSYNWLVPAIQSNTCLVRISDSNVDSIFSTGNFFSIGPPISIEQPDGGEIIIVYSIYPILWSSSDEVVSVLLDYSIDGGANWLPINTTPSSASVGQYDWFVPDNPGTQTKVRIRKSDNAAIFDESEGVFIISSVMLPPANLTAEAGSEVVTLNWDAPGSNVGYNIYRGDVKINMDPVDTTGYIDYDVINGQTYSYYIKAVYSIGESEPSNVVEVTPLPITYTITATAGEGGSIEPVGEVLVEHGSSQSFAITSDEYYEISDVLVDSESVGVVTEYQFENVIQDHTIEVIFELGTSVNGIYSEKIQIFPNPFSSSITILNTEGVVRIDITNILGETLKSIVLKDFPSANISTDELIKGVYFINIYSINGEIQVRKIVKY